MLICANLDRDFLKRSFGIGYAIKSKTAISQLRKQTHYIVSNYILLKQVMMTKSEGQFLSDQINKTPLPQYRKTVFCLHEYVKNRSKL